MKKLKISSSGKRSFYLDKILRIMKLTSFLIFINLLHISATSYSQNERLTIQLKNATLKEMFAAIENQSSYKFLYRDDVIDKQLITISAEEMPLVDILHKAFDNSESSFRFLENNLIVIASKQSIQHQKVTGTVTDASNGDPLIGVNVVIEGSTVGAVTNAEGKFVIEAQNQNATLVFSYIGYLSEKVAIAGKANIDVKLTPDITKLDEVVVVGYGLQKKVNLTGAITELKSDDITKRMSTNTAAALQGIAPGVIVTREGSQPGRDGSNILIRGNGSFSTTGPLILIDGIEASSINNIDPDDIQSMSVLKDASASSIYGSKAASGVILITSKRAKGGQMEVNYNGHASYQMMGRTIKNVDGLTHIAWMNEAYKNDGATPIYNQTFVDNYTKNYQTDPDHYPNTNWADKVLKSSARLIKHNLSVMGGNEKINYLASLNYQNQDGIINNTNDKRYSFRINSDVKISNKFTSSFDISGQRVETNAPNNIGNQMVEIWRKPAIYTPTYSDGRYSYGQNGSNPLALINDGGIYGVKRTNIHLNIKLDYKPFDGLKFTVNAAPSYRGNLDNTSIKTINYYTVNDPSVFEGAANAGKNSISGSTESNLSYTVKGLVEYEKTIAKHNLKILGGFEQSYNRYDYFWASRESRAIQSLDVLNAGQGTQANAGTANETALRSFFGRLNYDYAGKYLLEANIRRDGSSRFIGNKRYGIFPSFSAGWRVTEEEFMKSQKIIDNLKVRASWGQLGNERAVNNNYPFASSFGFNDPYSNAPFTPYLNYFSYPFGGVMAGGAALLNMPNTQIGWENSEMSNIGLDLGFLNNKLSITAEYYVKNTKDILTQLPLAVSSGVRNPTVNAFSTQDKGWEVSVGYQNNAGDFSYSARIMVSDNTNTITDMKGRSGQFADLFIRQEGADFNSMYGFQALGIIKDDEALQKVVKVNANTKPGDIAYADLNGDNLITDAYDRKIIGSTTPHYNFGGNFDFGYKGIELSLFIQGVGKRDGYLSDHAIIPLYNGGTAQEMHADHWTPEHTEARFPRLSITTVSNYYRSSFWVQNAAYIKLKNIQLGYNLPKSIIGKLKIKGIKLYVSGEDLLSFDHYKDFGFDPETSNMSGNVYPFTKSYSFGVNVKF